MRLLKAVTVFLVFVGATAMACPHNAQRFMCPGDPVVDQNGTSGTVVAVNPFNHTVAVQEYGQNYNFNIDQLALGAGCLEGYCVGDPVVDQNGTSGTIAAVNPYTEEVAVSEYSQNYIFRLQDVSIGYGCIEGYCVGDSVVDQNGTSGLIAAVNPYSEQVAVAEYGQNYLFNVQQVSNANFCAKYGDADRSIARYPIIDPSFYISAELHFSMKRPVRDN